MKSKARLFRLLEDKGFPRSDTENAATGEGETKNGEKEKKETKVDVAEHVQQYVGAQKEGKIHEPLRTQRSTKEVGNKSMVRLLDSPVRRFQNTWLYDINVCGRINPNELTRVDGIGFDLRTLHRARVCNRIIERSYEIVARYK